MTAIYVSLIFVFLIAVVVIIAFYYGKKDSVVDQQKEDLKRAKAAGEIMSKPVRSKSDIIKWMRGKE